MELTRVQAQDFRSRVRGCLLGGAVGDALGAPVEFRTRSGIHAEHGDQGVREYVAEYSRGSAYYGLITDDTQMTLFTMEGLIRAGVRRDRGIGFNPVGILHQSYVTWYETQTLRGPSGKSPGWLQGQTWLYDLRAPGDTCLRALEYSIAGMGNLPRFGAAAANDSKGCGGVMRSAPVGLLPFDNAGSAIFAWAAEAAGLTHGHPSGKLASGALALLVHRLVAGADLMAALDTAMAELTGHDGHEETTAALRRAREAAAEKPVTAATVEGLGGGWIAEEALAIAVYCALVRARPEEFVDALALSVTHSGDSDSTGAICGNILGALHGETALPPALTFEVEGRATMLELADDFVWEFTAGHLLHGEYGPWTRWADRYQGT